MNIPIYRKMERVGLLCVVLFAVVLVQSPTTSRAARVLLVPANINSHFFFFGRLAKTLARLGHTTHMLVPSNGRIPADLQAASVASQEPQQQRAKVVNGSEDTAASDAGSFSIHRYLVDGNVSLSASSEFSVTMMNVALTDSTIEKFRLIGPMWTRLISAMTSDCNRLMSDSDLMRRLRSTRFDVAIMDPAAVSCYILPLVLGIPHHASLSAPCFALPYRQPRLPSFVSDVGHSDRMSFSERMSSFLQTMLLTYVMIQPETELSLRYLPDRSPAIDGYEVMYNSSFWLYLEEATLSYPRPLMPNTIQVGDLMAGEPGRPLPEALEQFLTEAADGVIIVSFGSFLDAIPDAVLHQFCTAFASLDPKLRVVWKQTNVAACKGIGGFDRQKSLLTLPWIPQNDLLADRRVRLFVTHGGISSLVETIYHGKPVVVVPVFLDQPANAGVVVSRGYGVRVDLSSATDDIAATLLTAIHTVLDDHSYGDRVKLAQSMMLARRDTPADRVSNTINHVIQFGDSHWRTGAFELSVLQFLMFDLFVALTAVFILLTCCLATSGWLVWRRCCSKQTKQKSE